MTITDKCAMCAQCCKISPIIRMYEMEDIKSALSKIGLGESVLDGRKIVVREGYCAALDQKNEKVYVA